MPDSLVANRLRRTTTAIALRRSRLGIAKYGNPGRLRKDWTETELALLETLPDREAARKLYRTQIAVMVRRALLKILAKIEGHHRWNHEEEVLLRRKRPNSEIAKLLKIPVVVGGGR